MPQLCLMHPLTQSGYHVSKVLPLTMHKIQQRLLGAELREQHLAKWWARALFCMTGVLQPSPMVWGPDLVCQCNGKTAPMLHCALLCFCTSSASCYSLLSPRSLCCDRPSTRNLGVPLYTLQDPGRPY